MSQRSENEKAMAHTFFIAAVATALEVSMGNLRKGRPLAGNDIADVIAR